MDECAQPPPFTEPNRSLRKILPLIQGSAYQLIATLSLPFLVDEPYALWLVRLELILLPVICLAKVLFNENERMWGRGIGDLAIRLEWEEAEKGELIGGEDGIEDSYPGVEWEEAEEGDQIRVEDGIENPVPWGDRRSGRRIRLRWRVIRRWIRERPRGRRPPEDFREWDGFGNGRIFGD
jgi:hypothetical protein